MLENPPYVGSSLLTRPVPQELWAKGSRGEQRLDAVDHVALRSLQDPRFGFDDIEPTGFEPGDVGLDEASRPLGCGA